MKFLTKCKDGGPESTVTAYVLIEIKALFSIMLLRFDGASRDAMHDHAFHAVSWLFKGWLTETERIARGVHAERDYFPSPWPIWTPRSCTHRVDSDGRSWALTFRGPWRKTWRELLPGGREHTLTNGRIVVAASQRVME